MASQSATKRVLLVDDERELVEPLALRLSASGRYAVAVAFDGDAGFRKALLDPPDVALIDLSMPELDGWELCRRLRADPHTRHAKLVIMTAWMSRGLEKRAKEEGVFRVLLKPFEDGDLWSALADEPNAGPAGGSEPA
jgi:two-component system cell cycle response regulator